MAVTIDDIKVLIEAPVSAALTGRLTLDGARLDERHVRRIDKFDGENWKKFSFD